jgi:hypothetical protein
MKTKGKAYLNKPEKRMKNLMMLLVVMIGVMIDVSAGVKGTVTVVVNRSSKDFCFSDGKGCKIKVKIEAGKLANTLKVTFDQIGEEGTGRQFEGFIVPRELTDDGNELMIPTQQLIWNKNEQAFILRY